LDPHRDDDVIGVCSLNLVVTFVGESSYVSTAEGANFEDDEGSFTSVWSKFQSLRFRTLYYSEFYYCCCYF